MNPVAVASLLALVAVGCSTGADPIPEATADSPAVASALRKAACDRQEIHAWIQSALADSSETIRDLPGDSGCTRCLLERVFVENPDALRVNVNACVTAHFGRACVAAIEEQRACFKARCSGLPGAHKACADRAVSSGQCKSVRAGCGSEPSGVKALLEACATSKAHLETTALYMCGAEAQRVE